MHAFTQAQDMQREQHTPLEQKFSTNIGPSNEPVRNRTLKRAGINLGRNQIGKHSLALAPRLLRTLAHSEGRHSY